MPRSPSILAASIGAGHGTNTSVMDAASPRTTTGKRQPATPPVERFGQISTTRSMSPTPTAVSLPEESATANLARRPRKLQRVVTPLANFTLARSPHQDEELHGSWQSSPLPQHSCFAQRSSSRSPNLELEDRYNLVTEYRMGSEPLGSPVDTTIGSPSAVIDFDEDVESCDMDIENSHQQSAGIDPSIKAAIERATKKFRSQCWKEFVPILEDGVVVAGRCKHCDTQIAAKRGAGTSSLLVHLRRCKQRSSALRIAQDIISKLRSPCGSKLKDWRYDPEVSRNELMRMISLHGFPFIMTEYDGVRRFVASLNPLFKMPCRTTTRNGCMKDYHEKKLALKEMFKNSNSRFSLTADMWTSNQTLDYIVVTCHFIDADWKLQKRIIKFFDVKTPHTGVELFNNIQNCVQDWAIEDKLFGITLDNASANTTMVNLLKHSLLQRKILPAEGNLLHHRCAGHVINLIVKDGLKVVEPVIENIRESVKYVRSSVSRKQMFKEIIQREGIKCKKKPGLDISTRWNSTLSMLETALKFRVVYDKLKSEDQRYLYAPSSGEWKKAEVLCRLLVVFKDATEIISGSKYPTSNLYFHLMWKIKLTLEQESSDIVAALEKQTLEEQESSDIIAEIAQVLTEMKKKFNKYWKMSFVLLCVPVVFDPRYKLKFIDFLFTESFPTRGKQRFQRVESLVRQLFQFYSSQGRESNVESVEQRLVDLGVHSMRTDPWAAWDQKLSNDLQSERSTELDRYLGENPVPRSKEFDILKWWKVNESKYPVLACIAKDLLAIPASSVASESAFSASGRIINDFRSSLLPETVEALICTQDWFRAKGSTEFSMESINDLITSMPASKQLPSEKELSSRNSEM